MDNALDLGISVTSLVPSHYVLPKDPFRGQAPDPTRGGGKDIFLGVEYFKGTCRLIENIRRIISVRPADVSLERGLALGSSERQHNHIFPLKAGQR